jgi:hypothetical protein
MTNKASFHSGVGTCNNLLMSEEAIKQKFAMNE